MNWDAIGAVAELLGAIGVILTLVYLAIQIRQNTDSVRIVADMDMSKQIAAWGAKVALDPELARIYDLAATDPETLKPDERSRFLWFILEIFMLYEGQYQLYKRDGITEDLWNPKRDLMLGFLKNPIIKQSWVDRMAPFSNSFFCYVEGLRIKLGEVSFIHQSVANPNLTEK